MENELICFLRRFEQLPKERYWKKLGEFKSIIEAFESSGESSSVVRVVCKIHEFLCKKYIEKFCQDVREFEK